MASGSIGAITAGLGECLQRLESVQASLGGVREMVEDLLAPAPSGSSSWADSGPLALIVVLLPGRRAARRPWGDLSSRNFVENDSYVRIR